MKIPEILLVETIDQRASLASVLAVIADERLAIEQLPSLGVEGIGMLVAETHAWRRAGPKELFPTH
ncbi:MAG: hypothetical protein WBM03_15650 [Steroidobacteraceae bacterium]